jgi:Ferritin-like domain
MSFHEVPDPALEDLDKDGAIREALDRLPRSSRSSFLKSVGGGLAAAIALGRPPVAAAALSRGDVAILNYALTLEYLQDAFYTEAERKGALSGPAARLPRGRARGRRGRRSHAPGVARATGTEKRRWVS